MELIQFSTKTFRIFSSEVTLNISNITTLVGANNEGKSSICDALCIFFGELGSYRDVSRGPRRYSRLKTNRVKFDYERDCPYTPPGKKGRRGSPQFKGIFKINGEEAGDLKQMGAVCNREGNIDLSLSWSHKEKRLKFKSTCFSDEKLVHALPFFRERIKLLLIPAIRDEAAVSQSVYSLIDEIVIASSTTQKSLSRASSVLKTAIQKRISKIEKDLLVSTKAFLPGMSEIRIDWDIDIQRSLGIKEMDRAPNLGQVHLSFV